MKSVIVMKDGPWIIRLRVEGNNYSLHYTLAEFYHFSNKNCLILL